MERGGYRPQLDGLRAAAIGLVLIEHFSGPTGIRELFPIAPGTLGVYLFFVLSGFLITRNFLSRLERHAAFDVMKHFYVTRAARLVPAYYLTLLATFLAGVPTVHDFLLWHVFYLSNYLVATGGPITVFWTLAVEEQFYLLLPFVVLACRRNAIMVALMLIATGFLSRVVILSTGVLAPWPFQVTILGNFETLGIGVLIGALTHARYQLLGRLLSFAAICCLVFQVLISFLWPLGIVQHSTLCLTLGVFFGWVVLIGERGEPGILAWISSFTLVQFVGKISYGVYLMHVFFPLIFHSHFVVSHFGVVPLPIQGCISLMLSLVIPALSWRFIESPIMRLKDRLWRRYEQRRAPLDVCAAAD